MLRSHIKLLSLFILTIPVLSACALISNAPKNVSAIAQTTLDHVVPSDLLKVSKSTLDTRRNQTRSYSNIREEDILSASAAILQDLGFTIDESEPSLGLVAGSKERSALTALGMAKTGTVTVLTLGIFMPSWDERQTVKASIVTQSRNRLYNKEKGEFTVRVAFQRTIWDSDDDISKVETISDPKVYQGFFERLSKSIYLERNKI